MEMGRAADMLDLLVYGPTLPYQHDRNIDLFNIYNIRTMSYILIYEQYGAILWSYGGEQPYDIYIIPIRQF